MADQPSHIIRKTYLEVEVENMAQAIDWQERLSGFAKGPLSSRLEQLFDQKSSPKEVLQIDQMVVSAEVMDSENWEMLLLEAVARQLENEFEKLEKSTHDTTRNVGKKKTTSTEESLLSSFFHFLKTGQLPWSTPLKSAEQLEGRLFEIFTQGIHPEQLKEFYRLLRSSHVRKRLVRQFPLPFLKIAALSLLEGEEAELNHSLSQVQGFARSIEWKIEKAMTMYWKKLFAEPEKPLGLMVKELIVAHFTERPHIIFEMPLFPAAKNGFKDLSAFAQKEPEKAKELARWAEENKNEFEAFAFAIVANNKFHEDMLPASFTGEDSDEGVKQNLPSEKKPSTQAIENQAESTLDQDFPPIYPWASTEKEIFIRNAGAILAHPFLVPLFSALDFVENGKMTKPHRAVHLVHFIATGQTEVMEHEMPLSKLLCGMPLETPVHRQIKLSKKEKSEAENMLQALVGHWSALGESSVEGLRGTFLCREGKLSKNRREGWRLQIEQKAFDVLLDQLPWSISRIQTPFMSEPLWVEWRG